MPAKPITGLRPGKPVTSHRDQPGDGAALVIVDMINRLDFDGAESLAKPARMIADHILRLRMQADAAGVPVIYVNDNFGEWHSERSRLVEHARETMAELVGALEPRGDDFFVIKPQFSGFYATNLPVLLPKLGVTRLILTGIATDICVLFTAADAHMRDYALWVPEDAVASESAARGAAALEIMRSAMQATTTPSADLPLADWIAGQDKD